MTTPDNALQAGIYTRLTNYAALTAVIGANKVFDHVPQGTSAPYVVIGEDTLAQWDTKSKNGWNCTVTIHAWTLPVAGRKTAKTIMGHVYDALHRQESNITVTGFSLVEFRFDDFQQVFQETGIEGQNDSYYHGVARYRAVVTV